MSYVKLLEVFGESSKQQFNEGQAIEMIQKCFERIGTSGWNEMIFPRMKDRDPGSYDKFHSLEDLINTAYCERDMPAFRQAVSEFERFCLEAIYKYTD